ncbi:MAG: hypothetical protein A2289_18385 [Deltaproteobacteria bacterium RIFOXYA12_FULL_58_15]|nr:MAG: hypothetical protein A2289_18385 [Deltaproteobacteria bacterium RIFOXYA12_FULL_58_15]
MTPARGPEYELADLKKACGEKGEVVVVRDALETARSDFGLNTESDVLEFIRNDGLEKPTHANTAALEKYPKSDKPWVDSYDFCAGFRVGYIAFYRGPTGKFVIKSFKKNDKPDSRSFPMREALSKIKL